jgi:hypothetical protein
MGSNPELNLVIVRILIPVLYLSLLVLLRLLVVLVVLLVPMTTVLRKVLVIVLLQMCRPKLVARGDLGLIMGIALKIVMGVYQLVLVNVSVVHLRDPNEEDTSLLLPIVHLCLFLQPVLALL